MKDIPVLVYIIFVGALLLAGGSGPAPSVSTSQWLKPEVVCLSNC